MYEMKMDELNKSIMNLKTTKATLNQANLSNSKLAAENVTLKEKVSILETKGKNVLAERVDISTQTYIAGIRKLKRKKNTDESMTLTCAPTATGEKGINIL